MGGTLLGGILVWIGCTVLVAHAVSFPAAFNHDQTFFPLTGQHKWLQCEDCHVGGEYQTLSIQCVSCHNGRRAPGKPTTHVLSSARCDMCHSTVSFAGAPYTHEATAAGRCDTCHDGKTAPGKSNTHMVTTEQCDRCHATSTFAGAAYKHDATAAGKCDTCHNGKAATGKPSTHIATTMQCDRCHRTTGWTPATYANHTNPLLIGGHTGLDCKVCHPQSLTSAYYRDGVRFGFCSNCHARNYNPRGEHHNNASLQVNANCAQCHAHAGYQWGGDD